jgi:hypothetical protein
VCTVRGAWAWAFGKQTAGAPVPVRVDGAAELGRSGVVGG